MSRLQVWRQAGRRRRMFCAYGMKRVSWRVFPAQAPPAVLVPECYLPLCPNPTRTSLTNTACNLHPRPSSQSELEGHDRELLGHMSKMQVLSRHVAEKDTALRALKSELASLKSKAGQMEAAINGFSQVSAWTCSRQVAGARQCFCAHDPAEPERMERTSERS